MLAFPANDLPPNADLLADAIVDALPNTEAYTGDTHPIRLDKQFSVLLEGIVTKTSKDTIETSLATIWRLTPMNNPVINITGMEDHLDSDRRLVPLSKIYYTITVDVDMVSMVDVFPPLNFEFNTRLRADAGFPLYLLPSVTVHSVLINEVLASDTHIDQFQLAMNQAWQIAAVGANIVTRASSSMQVKYATSSW